MIRSSRVFSFVVAAALTSGVASAAPIISGDGEQWSSTLAEVCGQVGSGAPCGGTTVIIGEHPAWMNDALTDAHWVSYTATGYDGNVLAPRAGSAVNPTGQTPIMTITESFIGQTGAALSVRLWADDTLRVFFNEVEVKAPVFGQNTCADAPIGCEPNEYLGFRRHDDRRTRYAAAGRLPGGHRHESAVEPVRRALHGLVHAGHDYAPGSSGADDALAARSRVGRRPPAQPQALGEVRLVPRLSRYTPISWPSFSANNSHLRSRAQRNTPGKRRDSLYGPGPHPHPIDARLVLARGPAQQSRDARDLSV